MNSAYENVKFLCIFLCVCSVLGSSVSQMPNMTTCQNAAGYPINITETAGIWYETARFPENKVPACVEFNIHDNITNNKFQVQVNSVYNAKNEWRPEEELLTFAWNNNTQKGVFILEYARVNVTFKVLYYIPHTAIFVCGYLPMLPVTLLKVITRERTISAQQQSEIEGIIDIVNKNIRISWVEQSERCNGAAQTLPLLSVLITIVFLTISRIYHK